MANLFGNVVPGNFASDAPNWTLGTVITVGASSDPAVRGRWYMPPGVTGPIGFRLYNAVSQLLIASAPFSTVAEGWQESDNFASPVNIAGLTVVACAYTSAGGQYPFDAGIFPITSGQLTGTGGRFHNADAWPQSTSTTCYYGDLVTEPEGVDAVLAGTVPAAIGSFVTDVPLFAELAGSIPPVVGSFTGGSGGKLNLVVALFEQLLSCLCNAASVQPNPPAHCASRVGTEIVHDLGQYTDICCEGLAYVTLGDTFFSTDNFPDQDIIRQVRGSCAPPTWAQEFRVGLVRCISAGQSNGEPPSDITWTEEAVQNMYDSQTLRQVACCIRDWVRTSAAYDGMSVVVNRQVQTNPNGGCVERYMTVVLQFPNIDCFC